MTRTLSHCIECNEWVASPCAWSGCPFRAPVGVARGGSGQIRLSPNVALKGAFDAGQGGHDAVKIVVGSDVVLVDQADAWVASCPIYVGTTATSRFVDFTFEGRTGRLSRHLMGDPEGMVVDHINGNQLDNRRSNLRVCTMQENNWNRRRRAGGKCRYKGVEAHGPSWRAVIWPNGKRIPLGSFPTAEEAARAYDRAAQEHYGDFACLNFPDASAPRSAVLLSHDTLNTPGAK